MQEYQLIDMIRKEAAVTRDCGFLREGSHQKEYSIDNYHQL